MRRTIAAAVVALGLGTLIGSYTAQPAAPAEVRFADTITAEYPQLARLDALLYGWMVCDAAAGGWTPARTAEWLAGEPAEHFGVTDNPIVFGRFVVDAAEPLCSEGR